MILLKKYSGSVERRLRRLSIIGYVAYLCQSRAFTSSLERGAMPIPTLPALSILIRSVAPVLPFGVVVNVRNVPLAEDITPLKTYGIWFCLAWYLVVALAFIVMILVIADAGVPGAEIATKILKS